MTSKPLLSTPPETDQRRIVPGWLAQLTGMPSSQCVLAIGPSVRPDAMADEELSGRMIKEPLGTFGLALLEVITDWRVTRADGVYALKVIRETLRRMRQRSEVTFVRADYYGQYISGEVQLGTTGAVGVAEAQLDPALVAGKNTLSTLRGVEPPPNKWVWVKDLDAELALTAKNAPGLTVHYELILDRPERVFDATGQLRTEDNYAWHTLSAVNDDFGNMDIRLVLGDRKVRRLAYNINEATTLAEHVTGAVPGYGPVSPLEFLAMCVLGYAVVGCWVKPELLEWARRASGFDKHLYANAHGGGPRRPARNPRRQEVSLALRRQARDFERGLVFTHFEQPQVMTDYLRWPDNPILREVIKLNGIMAGMAGQGDYRVEQSYTNGTPQEVHRVPPPPRWQGRQILAGLLHSPRSGLDIDTDGLRNVNSKREPNCINAALGDGVPDFPVVAGGVDGVASVSFGHMPKGAQPVLAKPRPISMYLTVIFSRTTWPWRIARSSLHARPVSKPELLQNPETDFTAHAIIWEGAGHQFGPKLQRMADELELTRADRELLANLLGELDEYDKQARKEMQELFQEFVGLATKATKGGGTRHLSSAPAVPPMMNYIYRHSSEVSAWACTELQRLSWEVAHMKNPNRNDGMPPVADLA